MKRKQFIHTLISTAIGVTTLSAFKKLTDGFTPLDGPMPVLFVGHGSPMNGIEDTEFSRRWTAMAKEISTPKAVLVISAHWYARGTKITAMEFPSTIHDFGGFPQALFDVQYPAPGDPAIAKEVSSLVKVTDIELNHDWGLDHGSWTIIRHMYPKADIPILQLSIDYTKGPEYHYQLATELHELRKKGVLILGSGNMVHNLRMAAWDKLTSSFGYDWALSINEQFKSLILDGNHQALIKYEQLGREAQLAIPIPEHYLPLIYTLGLKGTKDNVTFFNDKTVGGSLTMTSVKFG